MAMKGQATVAWGTVKDLSAREPVVPLGSSLACPDAAPEPPATPQGLIEQECFSWESISQEEGLWLDSEKGFFFCIQPGDSPSRDPEYDPGILSLSFS